jgi:hypothetical protein
VLVDVNLGKDDSTPQGCMYVLYVRYRHYLNYEPNEGLAAGPGMNLWLVDTQNLAHAALVRQRAIEQSRGG